jgi:hypothetical protein
MQPHIARSAKTHQDSGGREPPQMTLPVETSRDEA